MKKIIFALGLLFFEGEVLAENKNINTQIEQAYLAGGCFWGMEELLREFPGVVETEVGYMGGDLKNPVYNLVKTGTTNHAETVRVAFDNKKTNYEKLLLFYFKIHDPTTLNRQGNDRGTQYRSAIFYVNDEQKKTAEQVRARVDKSKAWKAPVVTEIAQAKEFTAAEEEHQKYLLRNPKGYTCHSIRDLKF